MSLSLGPEDHAYCLYSRSKCSSKYFVKGIRTHNVQIYRRLLSPLDHTRDDEIINSNLVSCLFSLDVTLIEINTDAFFPEIYFRTGANSTVVDRENLRLLAPLRLTLGPRSNAANSSNISTNFTDIHRERGAWSRDGTSTFRSCMYQAYSENRSIFRFPFFHNPTLSVKKQ